MPVDPFLRRQIIAMAEAALRAADVVGVLPTPLERVGEVVGVAETIDIGDLPDDLTIAKPRSLRRILGAYAYRTNTAFVDLSQPVGRRRFIQAHETGHRLIPWHESSHRLDDEARLFRDTEDELEDEANLAGTLLVFQGGRFHAQALDYENSIRTPILLAEEFGASYHASIRYYVEHHPEPIALVIAVRGRGSAQRHHPPSGSGRTPRSMHDRHLLQPAVLVHPRGHPGHPSPRQEACHRGRLIEAGQSALVGT